MLHGSFAKVRKITCKCGRTEDTQSRNKKSCDVCLLKTDLRVKPGEVTVTTFRDRMYGR